MMAAKGRLPESAPQDMLDGANTRQTTMSTSVDRTTVTKLLASGIAAKLLTCGRAEVGLTVWFILL